MKEKEQAALLPGIKGRDCVGEFCLNDRNHFTVIFRSNRMRSCLLEGAETPFLF
jgi:hypothetical protein